MIVIPMAGLSSRFFKAGYTKPKYQLQAHGKTVFEWSVRTFEDYFDIEQFVFICRDVYDTPDFIRNTARLMGIQDFKIVVLNEETDGQADTVFKAIVSLKVPEESELLIFNIDTVRKNFKFKEERNYAYLEVFKGSGEHWSFAKPINKSDSFVEFTAEKKRISDLCSNGMYYFKSVKQYIDAFEKLEVEKGEKYIAPMYNEIIKKSDKVQYELVDINDHVFIGTPEEYNEFLSDE